MKALALLTVLIMVSCKKNKVPEPDTSKTVDIEVKTITSGSESTEEVNSYQINIQGNTIERLYRSEGSYLENVELKEGAKVKKMYFLNTPKDVDFTLTSLTKQESPILYTFTLTESNYSLVYTIKE